MPKTRLLFLVAAATFLMACWSDSNQDQAMPSRTVSVLELTERDFARERTLTGVIGLYREEAIGFEVGGRVTMVSDEGLQVEGPTFNEAGELIRQGDPIAAMEGTRYGSQVGALQARLDAARRDLDAAEAAVTLARQTLERQQGLFSIGAGVAQEVDNAESALDQATARLQSRRATVREVAQQLEQATEDLGDAVLIAPFNGRITRVHIYEGAVVEPGQPVVTLTLMDPVRVQVEVSADDERDIETGDRAVIFPKDPLLDGKRLPINAIVFEKSAVADPALRTFRIDLIARNQRRRVDQLYPDLKGMPIIDDYAPYLPVVRKRQGESGPLFAPTDSIGTEGDATYVLRLPGVSFNAGGKRSAVGGHRPEKVYVTLGDQYFTVVNWNFRSLVEFGDLSEGDFLIRRPQPDYVDGVAIGRPQWLLRPRDLVPVQFELSAAPSGFYVPIRAITLTQTGEAVLVAEDGLARERPVTVHETFQEYRRIEGDGITDGTQVIVGGVHYLSDGQPVSISEMLE